MRRSIVALVVLCAIPLITVWLVNQQWFLAQALRLINLGRTTQIALNDFGWNPLTSSMRIAGLAIYDERKGHDIRIGHVSLTHGILGFLRGKFIIQDLEIDGISIKLPPRDPTAPRRAPKELNIGRLLLLHSIIVEHARIDGFIVAFGTDTILRMDEVHWSLKPRFAGDTTLALNVSSLTLARATKTVLFADDIVLKTSTKLSQWHTDIPYLNAMRGTLAAAGVKLEHMPISAMSADMSYLNGRIELTNLDVDVAENKMTGNAIVDLETRRFDISIDIPKPISLPHIARPIETIDTACDISGRLEAAGEGLVPTESTGRGRLSLVARFARAPDFPLEIAGNAAWKDGSLTLSESTARVGSGTLDVGGSIDFIRKNMNLAAKGTSIPLEAVFLTFTNPHLQKIYGTTDVEGEVGGWGRAFKVKLNGITTDGGFLPMRGERIETEFTATYDALDFAWKLFQDDKQTAIADLTLAMGLRGRDGKRAKSIDLEATLSEHNIEPLFPGFGLAGRATGTISMKGPVETFTGTATARVVDGGWLGPPLDEAATDITLTRHKISFENASITPRTLDRMDFIEPMIMDLTDGRFRLHGSPLDGFDVDLVYIYDAHLVQIARIAYQPPGLELPGVVIKGTVAPGGAINLTADGSLDLAAAEPLHALVREAAGPVEVDLRIVGSTSSPAVYGTLVLTQARFSPRFVRLPLESLTGTVRFDGHRIHFDGIEGLVDDGRFTLGGWIEHREWQPHSSNLSFRAKELYFRTADNAFRMEFDGELALAGAFPHPLLAGSINIIDGRYTKDFVLLEQLGAGARRETSTAKTDAPAFDPRLNLTVSNAGELLIRNNVGDIDLKADIMITGRRSKPEIHGAINVREGRINYLGLKFDITRGFVDLRGPYGKPYLEVEAQRELRLYNIDLRMYGYTDNLALDLEGSSPSGPLDKRDIISLLAFGITEQERREYQAARTGSQIGISVAAQQVGQMLERPITEATHLDVFRVEAAEEETGTGEPGKMATRLRVGKRLTDRLSIDFTTDIDTSDAEQTVMSEYLITDNVLLKGSRSSDGKYEGNIGLRFRLR